jgi:hypothetical protein
MEVLLFTVTPVAVVPPSFTVAPGENPVPVMVTVAPPLTDPEFGVIAVTVGAGGEPCPLALKATICITQVPEVNVAVAL